jgi:hypothetical protein
MWVPKPPPITKVDVEYRRGFEPRRIAFAYTHSDQPKRTDREGVSYVGSFSVPFLESVGTIFTVDTGLRLFPSKVSGGFWHSIRSEQDFEKIEKWVKSQGTRIFLRDCLDISIALDQNLTDNVSGQYTVLGKLESAAKNEPDEDTLSALMGHYCTAITNLPGYRDAKYIAAVPPRPDKLYDLPFTLAQRIANRLGLENLTLNFNFQNTKGTVKALSVSEKWGAWEQSGLTLARKLDGNPSVILIDDKYQSGITIQFVASRLRAAGAGQIFGLCAVKTLRDTDNT